MPTRSSLAASAPATTGFRTDVEGLRAVAVGGVILYHFGGSDGGNAGFVGVDIFFVISGYLITRLIVADLHARTFSFVGFYARRARRILPALSVVTLCTLATGAVLLTPADLGALGREAAAAALGIGNVNFWLTSGYFEQSAETRPLLHTWSLGVEEQFYLVWPALALALHRLTGGQPRVFLSVLLAIIAASFAANQILLASRPEFVFYMLPTRAWQMATGAALVFVPAIRSRAWAETMGAAGLALMLGAIVLIDPGAPYPGWTALAPTLGAALIIWPTSPRPERRHPSVAAHLLSFAPMTAVGRLSYALYLWHWPVLVLFKVWNLGRQPNSTEAAILLAAVVVLSVATYIVVETPLRRRLAGDGATLAAGGGAIALIVALGIATERSGGLPGRLTPEAQRIAAFKNRQPAETGVPGLCNLTTAFEITGTGCPSHDDPRPRVLLFGDSHADHLSVALATAFPGVVLTVATASGCRPVLQTTGRADCVAFVTRVLRDHVPQAGYATVILAARWRNGQSDQAVPTADWLRQHTGRVLVIGQTMEYTTALPEVLLTEMLPRRALVGAPHLSRVPALREIDRAMAADAADRDIEYFSMLDTICPAQQCTTVTPDGVPVSWDYGHFNPQGADLMVRRLAARGLSLP